MMAYLISVGKKRKPCVDKLGHLSRNDAYPMKSLPSEACTFGMVMIPKQFVILFD